jgi:hypothetical protein
VKRRKVMRLLAPIAHRAMFEGFAGSSVAGGKAIVVIQVEDMKRIVEEYTKLWLKFGEKAARKNEVKR